MVTIIDDYREGRLKDNTLLSNIICKNTTQTMCKLCSTGNLGKDIWKNLSLFVVTMNLLMPKMH